MRAFGSLVAKYQDRLYNAMLRMTGNPEEAADLCQEAFVKAIEKIVDFRGQSQFYTWLFRIAMNLAISGKRRAARIRFASLSADPDFSDNQATGLERTLASTREADPCSAAASAETQRHVLQAIAALDEEHRAVVVLRDIENMDYEQMAAVLALPMGTVKSRLHRARCMLKEKLSGIIRPAEL